jgi:hypothetical protein
MKQNVEYRESDDYFIIALTDEDSYLFEKFIEPQDKPMKIGLTSTGEVRIKEIDFPKTTYHGDHVKATADKIQHRFEQEGCKSCTVLAEVSNTEQTFIFPTPKQILGQFLDQINP